MTEDKDFKKIVRSRAARTGESYQTAWLVLRSNRSIEVADKWLAAWWDMVGQRSESASRPPLNDYERAWLVKHPMPLDDLQLAATRHPNAKVRATLLTMLDHHASDASVAVFRAALSDRVPHVRRAALHGISCERCRVDPLDPNDLVPDIVRVASSDPNDHVRYNAVLALAPLVGRDERARRAVQTAATNDADRLVRDCATAVLEGRWKDVTSRRVLRQRSRTQPVAAQGPAESGDASAS